MHETSDCVTPRLAAMSSCVRPLISRHNLKLVIMGRAMVLLLGVCVAARRPGAVMAGIGKCGVLPDAAGGNNNVTTPSAKANGFYGIAPDGL